MLAFIVISLGLLLIYRPSHSRTAQNDLREPVSVRAQGLTMKVRKLRRPKP